MELTEKRVFVTTIVLLFLGMLSVNFGLTGYVGLGREYGNAPHANCWDYNLVKSYAENGEYKRSFDYNGDDRLDEEDLIIVKQFAMSSKCNMPDECGSIGESICVSDGVTVKACTLDDFGIKVWETSRCPGALRCVQKFDSGRSKISMAECESPYVRQE